MGNTNNKHIDEIYGAKVMYLIVTPFTKQPAYKLGLIDAHGNRTKQAIKTEEQKEAYTALHKICFALKQMIDKLPAGNTKVKQMATALHYVKQNQVPIQYREDVEDPTMDYLKMLEFVIENDLRLIEEELHVQDAIWFLSEDAGGAAVAGGDGAPANSVAGIEPHDQPVIDGKKKRLEKIYARVTGDKVE